MRQWCLISVMLTVYAVWVSIPILSAGYYSDDVPNGLVLGVTQLTHQTIFEICNSIFLSWFYNGRIFPIAVFAGYPFLYFFHTLLSYQIAHVVVIWISLLAVAWMVKQVSKKIIPALLILFLIPVFWSVRNYHDPLTSFGTLLPCVTFFSALAIGFFIKAVEEKKWHWHIYSVTAYTLAICTYEIGVAAFVAIVLLAWTNTKALKEFLKNIMPCLIVSILYLTTALSLRHSAHAVVYEGIQLGSVSDFAHTFWNQFTAGLPLSYYLLTSHLLLDPFFSPVLQWSLVSGLFCVAALSFNYLLLRLTANNMMQLVKIGVAFVLTPACLIGISKKYQTDIVPGVGYLPVYMEYIGFALLLLTLIIYLLSFSVNKKIMRYMITFMLSVVVSIAFIFNYNMVRLINSNWQNPRTLVETAAQHGLFADLPANSVIYKYHGVWASPEFFMQNAAVAAKVVDLMQNDKKTLIHSNKEIAKNEYFMDYYVFPDSVSGYVILARLASIASQNSKAVSVTVVDPKVFLFSGKRKYIMFDGMDVTDSDVIHALKIRVGSEGSLNDKGFVKNSLLINLPKGEYQLNKLTHKDGLQ